MADQDAQDAYRIGHQYFARGDLEMAEQWWERAAPTVDDAAMNLAQLFLDTGRRRAAAKEFRDLARRGVPGALDRLQTVGLAQIEHHELDEAVHSLADAIELGHADAGFNLGLLYAQKGRIPEAMQTWAVAVELGSAESGTNLGLLLWEAGQHDDAEMLLRMAWLRGDLDAAYNLGRLLADAGREPEAREAWEQAAEAGHQRAAQALGQQGR